MKRYCIIIPFHNPVSWHTDYANQTARLLARNHYVLCFLWGDTVSIKEILWNRSSYRPLMREGRLFLYQPLFLIPGKRFFGIQLINFALNISIVHLLGAFMCARNHVEKVLWFFGYFDPVFLSLPFYFPRTKIIYDCVDYPWYTVPRLARTIKKAAFAMCRRAWIVTANSQTLATILKRIRSDVITVPLGFRKEMFTVPSRTHRTFPAKKPLIGLIGAIDYRLDYDLLENLIRHNPTWQFALIGHVFKDFLSNTKRRQMERVLRLPNVIHTKVAPSDIPAALSHFSVAMIPYDIRIPFNRYSFPMKFMEYLYAGKLTVSTPIRELALYTPYVQCASTERDWQRVIAYTLRHPPSGHMKRDMRSIASSHTWKRKIRTIQTMIRSRE